MVTMSQLRDRFSDLLEQLLADRLDAVDRDLDADGDVGASIRLLANALLNVATTVGPEAITAVRRVAPWLEVYLRRELDGAHGDGADLAADLPATAEWLDNGEGSLRDRLVDAARDAGRLDELTDADEVEFADRVIGDTRLARIVCKAAEHGEPDEIASRARRMFPMLREAGRRDTAPPADALEVLERLESGDGFALQDDPGALGDEARNFETSLAANMQHQGMSPAVRAALMFGPNRAEGLPTYLFACSTFREEPELAELAGALTTNRGRAIRYYRGGAPFEHLAPWAEYLRDGCRELARRRDVSYREAVSFAHFCFHLMNACDLATLEGGLTDEVRDGIMAVEDELKEFALAGRRSNVAEGLSDLASYDEMRWASSGPSAYLADRLARLGGVWREDGEQGPTGAPPRLDEEMYASALEVWEQTDQTTRTSLEDALGRMHLVGLGALEGLDVDQLGRLLALATKYARDLPGVDITQPFWVDVSGLLDDQKVSPRAGRRALAEVLEDESMSEMLSGQTEPETPGGVGLVGEVAAEQGAEADATLELRLELDAESAALLSLLEDAFADGDDDAKGRLRRELREKVREQFDDTQQPDPSSTTAA
jgi:hypothetical protein